MMIWTVTDLVNKIKNSLEGDFPLVTIKGEISNYSPSSSGHFYFNLKDQDAIISCAMFRMDALRSADLFKAKNGSLVQVTGAISVYLKKGNFQLIVRQLTLVGLGSHQEKFLQLKEKLAKEGLFDLSHKIKIPPMPKKVAIITAKEGAALQDFLNILKRRSKIIDVLIIPSMVQGEDAPRQLRQALFMAQKYHQVLQSKNLPGIDIVIFARGGGSLEDLWAFNDEGLVIDIFNCEIPVISAIGHEVDYSLCDYVADLRAETPSAAAELITTFESQYLIKLQAARNSLLQLMNYTLISSREKVLKLSPQNLFSILMYKFKNMSSILDQFYYLAKNIDRSINLLEYLKRMDDLSESLNYWRKDYFVEKRKNLEQTHSLLKALNPHSILTRGYTILSLKNGKIIKDKEHFSKLSSQEKSDLEMTFQDGKVKINLL